MSMSPSAVGISKGKMTNIVLESDKELMNMAMLTVSFTVVPSVAFYCIASLTTHTITKQTNLDVN